MSKAADAFVWNIGRIGCFSVPTGTSFETHRNCRLANIDNCPISNIGSPDCGEGTTLLDRIRRSRHNLGFGRCSRFDRDARLQAG
jgi:hypothetical protein